MPEETESQAIEGYGCACGFVTDSLKKFRAHLLTAKRTDPSGEHRSIGRVNLLTGEVVLPPWEERTPEQLQMSKYGRKKNDGHHPVRTTEVLADATEIKVVPRVYTIDYSPILRSAQEAAVREWGWRKDMPLGNFIDTVIYNFFYEHGIRLAAYLVETEEETKEVI